jgi:hypothetical protein
MKYPVDTYPVFWRDLNGKLRIEWYEFIYRIMRTAVVITFAAVLIVFLHDVFTGRFPN